MQGLGDRVICNADVSGVAADSVTTRRRAQDSRRRRSSTGAATRGGNTWTWATRSSSARSSTLAADHGLTSPILMDATVKQVDGFRFLYTLPLSDRRLLIEDTRYSESPRDLDREPMRTEINGRYADQYDWLDPARRSRRGGRIAGRHGWRYRIVLGGRPGLWPRSGVRAGLFHYVTGYSLPEAVDLADEIAARPGADSASLHRAIRARSRDLWRRGRFYRLLNRMLFRAARPDDRYRVLQHFYRLPEDVVHRFYAGRNDAGEIACGFCRGNRRFRSAGPFAAGSPGRRGRPKGRPS